MNDQVHSVALLLTNEMGLLYCVRERQSNLKYGKRAGDRTFPWETRKPGELFPFTMHRLLVEEVDYSDQILITPPNFLGTVPVYDTVAHVFVASFIDGPANMRGIHEGIEIDALGWQTQEFLLARCRDGVPEVLQMWSKYRAELVACK